MFLNSAEQWYNSIINEGNRVDGKISFPLLLD
jgi:hypothetical protein